MKIKIEPGCEDGVLVSNGTKIYTEDGAEIRGIYSLSVHYPLDGAVVAHIELYVNPGSIEAHPLLSIKTLAEAAYCHGYVLTPISKEDD